MRVLEFLDVASTGRGDLITAIERTATRLNIDYRLAVTEGTVRITVKSRDYTVLLLEGFLGPRYYTVQKIAA
jgi:hypothetical protein